MKKDFLLIGIYRNLWYVRNTLRLLDDPDSCLWTNIRRIHKEIGQLLDKLQGEDNAS